MDLRQYSLVKVRHLSKAPDVYDGWGVNRRAPRVGDEGTIVDVLRAPDGSVCCVVECIDRGTGETTWLGDLSPDEIAPI